MPPRGRRAGSWRRSAADLAALTKPRITVMVLVTSAAGYLLGAASGELSAGLLHTLVGVALVAAGTSGLNQVLERDVDGLMERTRRRPLPAGRLSAGAAAGFSGALAALGVAYLALAVNLLTAGLAAAALLIYDFAYTPLKRVGSLATLVGAVPGALPVVGGWTAATGRLGVEAWALFAILFLWQLPHFLALAWLYRDDYRRAGLRMLTVSDPTGVRARHQAVSYALALLPVSLIPAVLGLGGVAYAVGAVALGVAYSGSALRFAFRGDVRGATGLFRTSLVYLPALLLLLAFDPGERPTAAATLDLPGEASAPAAPGSGTQRGEQDSPGLRLPGVEPAEAPALFRLVSGHRR